MLMNLQELITRGRFICANAPERLKVFEMVNGRRTAADIARIKKRHVNNVRRDLVMLASVGLIRERVGKDGLRVESEGLPVYEKEPLARTVPIRYFTDPIRAPRYRDSKQTSTQKPKQRGRPQILPVPTESEILDVCNEGEDQIWEFKSAGTDVRKLTKEIAAMLNTRQGGIILYGVDDSGAIQGSDLPRQRVDQSLHNSIKNSIAPAATVRLHGVKVMGSDVLVILVPPWNRKDVYQFDEKVYVRKGTNVFGVRPEESRKLHRGEYVV